MLVVTANVMVFTIVGRVVYEKRHDRGGHFASVETPELLVADLRTMFGKKSGIGAKLPF